jgi:DNA-binding CsgD family transcriptional regulator
MAELVRDPAEAPSIPVAGARPEPSSREREVLALLAGGATDRQVAASLHLSPATVRTHVRNAKAKLGARTRAQAVALALQRHLIRSN